MKMKRAEAVTLLNNLGKVRNLEGMKFAYAIVKTARKIEDELKTMDEVSKPSPEYVEYYNKGLGLSTKYCKKDEKGNPISKNQIFQGLEGNVEYEDEKKKLDEQYKGAIEFRDKQIKQYNEMMDDEVEFEVHQIDIADIPEKITVEQMAIISKLIKE